MLEWLVYNCIIPLSPVFLVGLGFWLRDKTRDLFSIIEDGKLCFYSVTISAVLIRDLLSYTKTGVDLGMAIIGVIVCIILSSVSYGFAVVTEDAVSWKMGVVSIMVCTVTVSLTYYYRSKLGLL